MKKAKRRLSENKQMYDRWRTQIYRKDGFSCQKCGVKKNLEAHHIFNYSSHPESRYDVQNGITFCVKHHREFHKVYGNEDNNDAQVEEYIGRELNKMDKLF